MEGETSEHIKLRATSWSFNVRDWSVHAVPGTNREEKKKKKEKPNKILKNVSVTEPGSSLCWCRDRGEKQFGALHLGTEGDSVTLKTPVSPDLWGGHGGVPEVPPTLG